MAGECIKQITLCEQQKCTGCTACLNICPTNSITMREDPHAELHPVIQKETCIKCGLCSKVCPQMQAEKGFKPYECYAAWRSDTEKRIDSSSGGISALLAESIISQNGVFYGVEFVRDHGAYFTRIVTQEEIAKTQGSKYVQADLGMTFRRIGVDLSENRLVMFVGSPCQVAGLKSYIEHSKYKEYGCNLLTVDFLCHGTVPQKYLLEYLKFIEKEYAFHVDECIFRSNRPEKNYYLTLSEKSKVHYCRKAERDRYFYGFLHAVTCKECCMDCRFKKQERMGDITIGDFIGLGRDISFDFVTGINPSLVLVNTEKGKKRVNEILGKGTFISRPISEAVKWGPSLKRENLSSKARHTFRKRYMKKGFIAATKVLKYNMLFDMCAGKAKWMCSRCKKRMKRMIRWYK